MWRLIKETLAEMKSERTAAASAFAALAPATSSASSELFLSFSVPGPAPVDPQLNQLRPPPPPNVKSSQEKESEERRKRKNEKEGLKSVSDSDDEDEKDLDKGEETDDIQDSRHTNLYPPLLPSTPGSMPGTPLETEILPPTETLAGQGDRKLQELLKKLEELEVNRADKPPSVYNSNPFLPSGPRQPLIYPTAPPSGLLAPWPTMPPVPSGSGGGMGGAGSGRNDPAVRWREIIRDAVVDGHLLPSAFPVITGSGGGRGQWVALDWKILKEAKSAVAQYGLRSQFTASLLQHIFTANLLTPYDSRMVVQTLLPPSAQLHFYHKWQLLCEEAAAAPRQPQDPIYGVQAQMLMGNGPFVRAEFQTQFQTEVLQLSQQLASQALQSVHLPGQGMPPFSNIKQGNTKPYGKFIDRLHEAIMNHPDLGPELKGQLFDTLAYENANEKTKRALGMLPRGASAAEMLEAAKIMLEADKAAYVAAAVGAAVRPMLQRQKAGFKKQDKKCYNCGKLGHFKKQCKDPMVNRPDQKPLAKWCENCKKSSHNTNECRRKGNWKPSAQPPRVTTQVQGAWTAAAPHFRKCRSGRGNSSRCHTYHTRSEIG